MGSFSWLKSDDLTQIRNIAYGYTFKFLIPEEFGGGYIEEKYQDYGDLGIDSKGNPRYDMYELLAFWNKDKVEEIGKELKYDGDFPKMKEVDKYTHHNRIIGIGIGCHDKEIEKLKYPLKLVSPSFKGKYEDLDKPSYGDPEQGFYPVKR